MTILFTRSKSRGVGAGRVGSYLRGIDVGVEGDDELPRLETVILGIIQCAFYSSSSLFELSSLNLYLN